MFKEITELKLYPRQYVVSIKMLCFFSDNNLEPNMFHVPSKHLAPKMHPQPVMSNFKSVCTSEKYRKTHIWGEQESREHESSSPIPVWSSIVFPVSAWARTLKRIPQRKWRQWRHQPKGDGIGMPLWCSSRSANSLLSRMMKAYCKRQGF